MKEFWVNVYFNGLRYWFGMPFLSRDAAVVHSLHSKRLVYRLHVVRK